MEEFSALAARVAASVGELRGCLILSRDGLVLGAYPEGEEGLVKPAWLRFAAIGEPEKGFVEFGDEVWAYARRGPYATFAVTGPGVRPGLVLDQLEQMLLKAEEVRSRREALKIPDAPAAPSSKPRTPLHPEVRPSVAAPAQAASPRESSTAEAPPMSAPAGRGAGVGSPPPAATPPAGAVPSAGGTSEPPPAYPAAPVQAQPTPVQPFVTTQPQPAPERPQVAAPAPQPPAPKPAASTPASSGGREPEEEAESEIDRVLLAQEFSRLLQETRERDEE